MKIQRVTAHPLAASLAEPFAFSQGWVHRRAATIVEIETADGIVGWGEAFTQGLEPPQIAAAVIEHALAPLLLGEDALATEVLWHQMYHATRDYGRKGSVVSAISAVTSRCGTSPGKCTASQCIGCWAAHSATRSAPTLPASIAGKVAANTPDS